MMNKFVKEYNILIAKRLTAILVAVVFVLGIAVIPAEIHGTETDPSATGTQVTEATEAVTLDAEQSMTDEDVAAADDEAATEEQEAAEADEATVEETAGEDNTVNTEAIGEMENALTVDLDSIDESDYDGFIYKLEDDVTKKEVKEMENAIDDLDEKEGQEVEEVVEKELYAADSIETIAEVAQPELIEYIEPNYIVRAMGTNDPYYSNYGWYLDMIDAPYIWDEELFGDDVTVAVLDSGVNTNHKDLKGDNKFTKPYNFVDDSQDVTDNAGHGTAVAGVIAASYNNGSGLTGIMPNTIIMPVKVVDKKWNSSKNKWETVGSIASICSGIDYAVSNKADVINMSLGSDYKSISLETKCQSAAEEGVILVAASGNEAQSSGRYTGVINPIEYPASYDTVISVGSIERDGTYSDFSNYNKYVTVSAPGSGILVPWYDGDYMLLTGTSLSVPQVSAMAAMVKQMDSSINYESFNSIIAGSSVDKGTAGYDVYYGYGLMNMKNAYLHLTEKDISVYDVSLSAASFTYDGTEKTPTVTVKQAGKPLSEDCYKITYEEGRTTIGTYNVTVEGTNGYEGSKTVSFTINPIGDISRCAVSLANNSYTYDGKTKTPSVAVSNNGKTVSSGYYKTAYASGRTAIGTYNVTVSGINGYIGTKIVTFNVVSPLVKGIKAPKRGKGKLTVRWKAMSKKQKKRTYKNIITGYQVRVSTSSNFANAKYASVKGIAKTSKTVKGLKKKTTYYVQYRSYKTTGSGTYYSKWSGTKKARTK